MEEKAISLKQRKPFCLGTKEIEQSHWKLRIQEDLVLVNIKTQT